MKRQLLGAMLVLLAAGMSRAAGPPVISGSSIVGESMVLVYGANFDDPAVRVHVQSELLLKATDPRPTEKDLRESLERVLAGKPKLPDAPAEKDRGWVAPQAYDGGVLATDAQRYRLVKLLRVRTAQGVSAPWVLNRPEVWGVSPHRAAPGAQVTVWGVNVGMSDNSPYPWFGVVSAQGQVVAMLKGYFPQQNQHPNRVQEFRFYRSLILPADLAAGQYKLYCWNGFGDAGWSETGHALQVVASPLPPKVVKLEQFGAAGDGVTDDTAAIERALAACAAGGGGRVLVPAGRFLISHMLTLPEGVSLVGVSPEASILEANQYVPFTGEIPESIATRPPDYDPTTYKYAGYGIDWFLKGNMKDRAAMVWLPTRAGVENLTLDATNVLKVRALVLIGHPQRGVCVAPTVRNCRLLSDHAGVYGEFPLEWCTEGVFTSGTTEDMTLERNLMRGSRAAWAGIPSVHRGARVRYNTFTCADLHDTFVTVNSGGSDECLFEDNVFQSTGRGHTGFMRPDARHNLWLHNTFRDLWKDDGEILMHEGGGFLWYGQAAAGQPAGVMAAGQPAWKPGDYTGLVVLLTSGPGAGQFRNITGNEAGSLTVDRPWAVAPDATSTFGVLKGEALENLYVGNEFYRCHAYCGVYGSGVRNVWVNEIYEDVSQGLTWWGIVYLKGAVQYLNLAYAEKFNSRAGVILYNRRQVTHASPTATTPEEQEQMRLVKVFGNEVRACSLRERRYVSSENGMIYNSVVRRWAEKGVSSPIDPVPGTEAAITVYDEPPYWSGPPTDPVLDTFPVSTRWNLLAENMIVRCPVGILLGKGVEHTILSGNSFYETPTPVTDLGKSTLNVGGFVSQGGKPVASP